MPNAHAGDDVISTGSIIQVHKPRSLTEIQRKCIYTHIHKHTHTHIHRYIGTCVPTDRQTDMQTNSTFIPLCIFYVIIMANKGKH